MIQIKRLYSLELTLLAVYALTISISIKDSFCLLCNLPCNLPCKLLAVVAGLLLTLFI